MSRGELAALVESAATEAFEASQEKPTDDGTAAEAPEAKVETPSSEGAEAEVVAETPPGKSEATPPAGEEGTDEPPMEYFGVDLSGLPADARTAIISEYQERDKRISQLQREEAAPPAAAPVVEPVAEAPEELTDEVLIQALSLNMDDEMDAHAAKTAVPLARLILELKDQVESLSTGVSATSEEARWSTALAELETTYGPLPVEREVFLKNAVEQRITDPVVAYWATVGPVRTALAKEVEKRLAAQRVAGVKGATTPRPKATTDVVPGALKSTNTRDAVKEAAEQVAKDLGVDWGTAWNER